jgi:hypothetical protein
MFTVVPGAALVRLKGQEQRAQCRLGSHSEDKRPGH